MKIWLTAPYDDQGIKEVEPETDPVGNCFSVIDHGQRTWYNEWFHEGLTWHRTKEAAVAAAEEFRLHRIQEAADTVARLARLPPVAA